MGRKKLTRFAENNEAHNVVEVQKPIYKEIKGNWHTLQFGNDLPITLEVGCGRGEYTTGLAKVFPERNFIGTDLKGARIWKGSQVAIENGLENVAFLRTHIQNLQDFFAPKELAEIWITFPDPRPKGRDERRRLTHPRFLEMYRNLLVDYGWVHLKTDSEGLFDYTLEVLANEKIQNLAYTKDLYNSPMNAEHYGISTTYEKMFTAKGFKINYLKFQFVP
jgi:tRNA (guanine-N7-)-methyltransferase